MAPVVNILTSARPPLANPSDQKLDSADFFEWIDECKTA